MVMITNSFDKFPNEPTGLMYEQFGKIGINTASDSAWVLRVKLHLTTKSTSSQSGFIGLTNTASGSNSSQDAIGMYFITVNNTLFTVDSNGQTISAGANSSNSFTTTNGNDYWIQITRLTTTTMRVEIFDNANYTGTASITINDTIPSGITGLRYLKMQNREELGNNGSSDNWTGDDVKFYNGVSSVSSGSSPTFEDNFSSNSGWGYIGTVSYNASGYQNLNFARNGSNNGCYHDLTTVKQHFIEWFSGKQLPSYWTLEQAIGASGNTGAMVDGVDGGYAITPAGVLDAGAITFSDKRQYAYNGSVCICVTYKIDVGGRYRVGLGESENLTLGTIDKATVVDGASGFIQLETADGTTPNNTDTNITGNTTTVHVHKIETKASSVDLSIDGVFKVTNTTEIPLTKLQPVFLVRGGGGAGNHKSAIRYMEAYNT